MSDHCARIAVAGIPVKRGASSGVAVDRRRRQDAHLSRTDKASFMSGTRRTSPRTSRQTVIRLSMRVWDAPTRLLHWAIVLLVVASIVSATQGWTQLHFLAGYAVLTLLLFRLPWGFVGSETSRFGQYLRTPLSGMRRTTANGRRDTDDELGHTAAGGWMVLVLLAALAFGAVTGLFCGAGAVSAGPLAHLADQATASQVRRLHAIGSYIILGVMAFHVVSVVAYAVLKREALLRPMITGRKRLPGNFRQPRMASPVLALMLVALAACIVWVVATRI